MIPTCIADDIEAAKAVNRRKMSPSAISPASATMRLRNAARMIGGNAPNPS